MFRFGFGVPGFMLIAMFLRFVVIAAIIVFIGRHFHRHRGFNNEAMRILDNKFASGEISEEEYLKRKQILNQR